MSVPADTYLNLSEHLDDPLKAQALASVSLPGYPHKSFSGYFTVDETTCAEMYFWFFPCEKGGQVPTLVWLQGGPGCSSLIALFTENGPFTVSPNFQLVQSAFSWTSEYNVLYIDNPVGTGYSRVNEGGEVENITAVGDQLYRFIYQFYQVFEEYRCMDLYVTGESYAGKYVPAMAFAIHENNEIAEKKIPLKGISIGDGLMEPIIQFTGLGNVAYCMGLADQNERDVIDSYDERTKKAMADGDTVEAFNSVDELINGDFFKGTPYFAQITGSREYFTIADPDYPANPYEEYLNRQEVRDALHVGTKQFAWYNAKVEKPLVPDFMNSIRDILIPLLENYKVLTYTGQFDLIITTPRTQDFLHDLEWSKAEEYRAAKKLIWKVNPEDKYVAGFIRQAGDFTQAVVRGAGHMVPEDQPARAFDLINRFINDIPF